MGKFLKIHFFVLFLIGIFSFHSADSIGQNPFNQVFEANEIIQKEISKDPEFEGANLRASFLDGVVTLEGFVDNAWQKKRLVEISQNINGAQSVVDKLEIAAVSIPSDELAKRAALALYRDETADVYELKVVTDNYGRIKLGGKADSIQEKKAAEDAILKVKGVLYAQNNIGLEKGRNRTDSEVQKDLDYAYYDNVLLDERMLETEVNKSVATVSGNVGSEEETLVVEEIAKSVAGIEEVRVSEVTVTPSFNRTVVFKVSPAEESYEDAALERAVDQANYYDTRVFSYNIDVEARNGVVELSGLAKSERAKQAALENARNTIGVKDVIDSIRVDEFSREQELLGE